MQELVRGVLITIEGIDGAGKSTLIKKLYNKLSNDEFPTFLTKEPGGSALGRYLRDLLHTQNIPMCPKAEYLLFAADRAEHMNESVFPALEQKKIVLSDRMADSSLAYQGYGRLLDIDMIKKVNNWVMNEKIPDLVLYIKIPINIALNRIHARGNVSSFEKKEAFLLSVEKGFDDIFSSRKNVVIVDGSLDQETLAEIAYEKVLTWLKQEKIW